jgi:hypothetical protein
MCAKAAKHTWQCYSAIVSPNGKARQYYERAYYEAI